MGVKNLAYNEKVTAFLFCKDVNIQDFLTLSTKGILNLFQKESPSKYYESILYQAEFTKNGALDYWNRYANNFICGTLTEDVITLAKELEEIGLPVFIYRKNKHGIYGIMIGPYWTDKLVRNDILKDLLYERYGEFE